MFTSFTILIHADEILPLKAVINKWSDLIDLRAQYQVPESTKDFYLLQIDVLDENRKLEEIAKFVISHLPFIALHQSGSQWIFARGADEFKDALKSIYNKDTKQYFFYDMLNIEERYHALMSQDSLQNKLDIQAWIHNDATDCYYALNIDEGSKWLFDVSSEVSIVDNETGSILEEDIVLGLKNYKFHIGILNS